MLAPDEVCLAPQQMQTLSNMTSPSCVVESSRPKRWGMMERKFNSSLLVPVINSTLRSLRDHRGIMDELCTVHIVFDVTVERFLLYMHSTPLVSLPRREKKKEKNSSPGLTRRISPPAEFSCLLAVAGPLWCSHQAQQLRLRSAGNPEGFCCKASRIEPTTHSGKDVLARAAKY